VLATDDRPCAGRENARSTPANPCLNRRAAIAAAVLLLAVTCAAAAVFTVAKKPTPVPASPQQEQDARNSLARLEAIEQNLGRLNTTAASLSEAVSGVREQLRYVVRVLDERTAQIKLDEPIFAEIVTMKRAVDGERCCAVCRVLDRTSRSELVYVVRLGDEDGRGFEKAIKEAVGEAAPASRSFAEMNELLSKAGLGPLAPESIWRECSFACTEPPRELERLLSKAFGVEPAQQQFTLPDRRKTTKWRDLISKIAAGPDPSQQAINSPGA
jgi:hypothetical protein